MEERLKNYNSNKKRMLEIKAEIADIQKEMYGPTGGGLEPTGIKPKGYMQSTAEAKIIKAVDKIKSKETEIVRLQMEIDIVDIALNILKPIERQVIELYYFKNLSISAIASTIGRDAETTVTRLRLKALAKMH